MRDRIQLTAEEAVQLYVDLDAQIRLLLDADYYAAAARMEGWCRILWDRLNEEEP